MKGNKRKQWGIIYVPNLSVGIDPWCKNGSGIELHYSKMGADKSRQHIWVGDNYRSKKYVKREEI